ncbi:TauD/TfdA dioxygenase family protein [Rhodopila sp.]|uniref:TauD/TfdA dioxygenase family protein n=1 Tax=Rhodopila sp. TaxID=2480087 RepID=UPI003D0B960D
MTDRFEPPQPLTGSGFGARLQLAGAPAQQPIAERHAARRVVEAAERDPKLLPAALADAGGLLLLPGLQAMADLPELLVRLSRVFGAEVEDYRHNLTAPNMVHPSVPEIFIVSNVAPVSRMPPRQPEPPLTQDGKLPTRFPHRRGWHTDQSYRRPPPDISLFLAVTPIRRDQGQTLFADATAAYAALPPEMQARLNGLDGIHVQNGAGRNRDAVLSGASPRELAPHERPQRQPLVRIHPVTGRPALYLCEAGQMDWLDGPIAGMQPGPDGDGGALLFELMSHLTRPEFVYVHEWTRGDLVVWDNRCLVHAATWFDAETESRVMWRTTVSGNPGPAYAGENKSWIPA